ncbi:MAG: zinc metallopeptidase [Kiritimatiellae bacterium]|nr:zinc metallopeptidase [Kiritimatiellia bacterium]
MIFDPFYMTIMLISMAIAGAASVFTKSTFKKYARIPTRRGLTGAQAAQRLLQSNGITDVTIEPIKGFLSDHYDPRSKVLRLSPDVYGSSSLSAIGVACHEAGHALQHAQNYAPLGLRSALVPAANFGSNGAWIFLVVGGLFNWPVLMQLGALIFVAVVVFSLVTLPVEWDATARAKRLMVSSGIVEAQEGVAAGRVLDAAFLTYIAAAITAILHLLYFLTRAGLLGGRD